MSDTALELTVTASSILFGFLFAGFWWALDRELKFKPDERHFKPAYGLLLVTMSVLVLFGVVRPLRLVAQSDSRLVTPLAGVTIAVVGVFGYMLTEFGHYRIFQRPKYSTRSEWAFFWLTIAAMIVMVAYWAW